MLTPEPMFTSFGIVSMAFRGGGVDANKVGVYICARLRKLHRVLVGVREHLVRDLCDKEIQPYHS